MPPALLALLLSFLCFAAPSLQWTGSSSSPFVRRHKRCPRRLPRPPSPSSPHSTSTSALFGGYGVASNYTWREEQYEIDVTVPVPAGTRASDVIFKATPTGVDLRLASNGGGDDGLSAEATTVLLDGSRPLRGKVAVDGTYWALSDREESSEGGGTSGDGDGRLITVTIEKRVKEPTDQFEVVEFDWGGVYPDDKDEVLEKKYDEPEELDVREYCKELGVDIDNINMSMVDKTMFSSGLNLTRSTLDELSDAGYVKEVTQQDFGKEFITDDDGQAVPFSPLGENVGDDEVREALARGAGDGAPSPVAAGGGIRDQLRDLVGGGTGGGSGGGDGPSTPWQNSMPVEEARIEDGAAGPPIDEAVPAVREQEGASMPDENETEQEADTEEASSADPIDLLTVKRLKEILREQGLKVGGNKQELRDRLRAHVVSLSSQDKVGSGEDVAQSD